MENIKPGEQYNLRWNNYVHNILRVFTEHLHDEVLVDVTLSCEGYFIKAHKLILSACSEYFRAVFKLHSNIPHPIIVLNGIKILDLKNMLEFIYRGEVKVQECDLQNLLALGDTFKVKGLYSVKYKDNSGELKQNESAIKSQEIPSQESQSPKPMNLTQVNETNKSHKNDTIDVSTVVEEKLEKPIALLNKPPLSETSGNLDNNIENLEDKIVNKLKVKQQIITPEKIIHSQQQKLTLKIKEIFSANPIKTINIFQPSVINVKSLEHSKDIHHVPEIIKGAKKRKLSASLMSSSRSESPISVPETSNKNVDALQTRLTLSDTEHPSYQDENDARKKKKPGILRRKKNNIEGKTTTENINPKCNENLTSNIPRPPNAFMIFANEFRKQLSVEHPGENNKDISVRLGNMWKLMSNETKDIYYKAAQKADEEHKLKYPSTTEARIRNVVTKQNKNNTMVDALSLVQIVIKDNSIENGSDVQKKKLEIENQQIEISDDDTDLQIIDTIEEPADVPDTVTNEESKNMIV